MYNSSILKLTIEANNNNPDNYKKNLYFSMSSQARMMDFLKLIKLLFLQFVPPSQFVRSSRAGLTPCCVPISSIVLDKYWAGGYK